MRSNLLDSLFLAVAGSISTASALPCTLTEQDYQSLANGSQKYSKADIEQLDAKTQDNLCKARKFYHDARGKDPETFAKTRTINDVPTGFSRFVTETEYKEVNRAMAEIMANSVYNRVLQQRR